MAATIDNTILYRNYNTIRMAAPARSFSYPFAVSSMTAISNGFYAYSPSALASAVRARTRFVGANGLTLSTVDHAFAIPAGVFTWIKIENIPVPAGAVFARFELLSTSGTWWAGLIKTEAGPICSDFTVNYSGQMTMITASGVYTGTIQAAQIVISSSEKLIDRLVTINDQFATFTSGLNSANSRINENTTQISSLGLRVSATEGYDSRITQIEAGKITLSSTTGGKLAGLTIDSQTLKATSGSYGVQISGDASKIPIWVGNSTFANAKFYVDWAGNLFASNAEIGGTLRAGTIINGSLNSTSGQHNGTHYGYHEGTAYTYSGSTLGGSLSGAGGSYYGTTYSPSGSLAGVSFYQDGGALRFGSSVVVSGILMGYGATHSYGNATAHLNLNVLGKLYTVNGAVYVYSDRNLKQNIRAMDDSMVDDLLGLEITEFEYRTGDGSPQVGVVAQDVIAKASPKFTKMFVAPDGGHLNVSYTSMIPILIRLAQKQEERIKELEGKIA